MKETFFKATSS